MRRTARMVVFLSHLRIGRVLGTERTSPSPWLEAAHAHDPARACGSDDRPVANTHELRTRRNSWSGDCLGCRRRHRTPRSLNVPQCHLITRRLGTARFHERLTYSYRQPPDGSRCACSWNRGYRYGFKDLPQVGHSITPSTSVMSTPSRGQNHSPPILSFPTFGGG